MLKFICRNCGAVNLVDETTIEGNEGDWLDCLEPKGFEWKLPAGKITPVVGPAIYISATGEHLSRDLYIKKYNLDPEIAYRFMRTRASKYVPHNGDSNNQHEEEKASRPSRTKSSNSSDNPSKRQELARASSPIRTAAWADEEDWV